MNTFNKEKLITIVSNKRSGATMFACLFDGHPDILTLRDETRFFQQFMPMDDRDEFSDIDQLFLNLVGRPFNLEKGHMELIGTHIDRDKNWRAHPIWESIQSASADIIKDEEIIKKAIATHDDKKIFLQLAELYKKYYWPYDYEPKYILEETPDNEFYLKKIFKMFPDAKVMHLVRDPFDVIESILRRGPQKKRLGLMSYIYTWKMSLVQGIKYKKKYPNNYCFVKYENLVENTEAVMRKMAEFLNIEFNDTLLYPTVDCGKEPWDCSRQSHQNVEVKAGTVEKRLLNKDAREVLGEDYMKIIGQFVGLEYELFGWNKYKEYVDHSVINNVLFGDYPGKNLSNMMKNLVKSLISWRVCQYKYFEYM